MSDMITVKRGLRDNLPENLEPGELAQCYDTNEVFIGDDGGVPTYLGGKSPVYFASVAEMKAYRNPKVGDVYKTLGYYEPNDGGAGEYYVTSDDGLVDDGGSVHDLLKGLKAELIINNSSVNVKQFGAKGNGVTDDTLSIQTALNSTASIVCIVGRCLITTTLDVPKSCLLDLGSKISDYKSKSTNLNTIVINDNIDGVRLHSFSRISGGTIDCRGVVSYDRACVIVDYSSETLEHVYVETFIIGNGNNNGVGIYIYAINESTGLLFPMYINSTIYGLKKGIYQKTQNTNSWFTGMFVNSTIVNCVNAIYLTNGGGGGIISGTIQPLLDSNSPNTLDEPLVYLGAGSLFFDSFIWDMNTAKNNVALRITGTQNRINRRGLQYKYIQDNNHIGTMFSTSFIDDINHRCYFPRGVSDKSLVDICGQQDNILLNICNANITIVKNNMNNNSENSRYSPLSCFTDSHKCSYNYLVDTNSSGDISYTINLLGSRPVTSVGVTFNKYYPSYSKIELYDSKTNSWVTVLPDTPLDISDYYTYNKQKGLLYWGYTWANNSILGEPYDVSITKIKLSFKIDKVIHPEKSFFVIDKIFANDGSVNFIPKNGGVVNGDLTIRTNNFIIVDDTTNKKYKLNISSGQLGISEC